MELVSRVQNLKEIFQKLTVGLRKVAGTKNTVGCRWKRDLCSALPRVTSDTDQSKHHGLPVKSVERHEYFRAEISWHVLGSHINFSVLLHEKRCDSSSFTFLGSQLLQKDGSAKAVITTVSQKFPCCLDPTFMPLALIAYLTLNTLKITNEILINTK